MKTLMIALLTGLFGWNSYAKNAGVEQAIAMPEIPVSSFQVEERKLLTDKEGITLYTFDRDSVDQSACSGGCLRVWPPMIVTSAEQLPPFGTIVRDDSQELQLTVNGLPLYYHVADKMPGDLNGEYPAWRPVPVQ